jgi:hypothetical protein
MTSREWVRWDGQCSDSGEAATALHACIADLATSESEKLDLALRLEQMRGILWEYMKADPSDQKGAPETELYKRATDAYFSEPGELAREVRDVMEMARKVVTGSVPLDKAGAYVADRITALLAKMGGEA